MKKSLFLALLYISCSEMSAQFVGGGGTSTVQAAPEKSASAWKNRFTLYAGPAIPTGAWGREVDASSTLTQMYTNNAGFGAKSGFYAEMGSMFYLKKLRLVEQMGIAINVTYINFVMNSFDWSPVFASGEIQKTRFLNLGTKIGATYSYRIADNLYADAYFNLCPSAIWLPTVSNSFTAAENSRYVFTVENDGTNIRIRKNLGFNIRYDVFTLGLDFLFGGIKSTVYPSVYDIQTGNSILNQSLDTKFRAGTMQIKLGFTI